jgi:ferritin-like metal-binding protein YciE
MSFNKSNMRLFNGHLKMDEASLKKVFIMQLSNIYCVRSYLIANLPIMAESASFVDLKNAILENVDEMKIQLLRIQKIYKIIGEEYSLQQCFGVRFLTIEAYVAIKADGMTKLEADLAMLCYLNAIESLDISCYKALCDIAESLPQDDMRTLLKQNLDMAKDSKELYELISKEYLK